MRAIVLLAFLLTLTNAFVDPIKYYFFATIRPEYAYTLAEGEQNNNRGIGVFEYDASKSSLKYYVGFTNSFYEDLTINGPVRCLDLNTGGEFGQNDERCVSNTGPVIYEISKGVSQPPEGTEPKQNVITGTISVSKAVEKMLFDGELYVLITRVSQVLPGEKVGKLNNILRGRIFGFSHDRFRALLFFESNDGSFSATLPKTGTSASKAVGIIDWSNPTTISYDIFHDIAQAGRFILQCPGKAEQISTNAVSPLAGNLDLSEEGKRSLLLSLFSDEGCFFFFTSSALGDGDLFARPSFMSPFEGSLRGDKMVPPIASGSFGKALIHFDRGHKTLTFLIKTNITDGEITSATVHIGGAQEPGSEPICTIYTKPENQPAQEITTRTYCRLNETLLQDLEDERLFVKINTNSQASGELRTQIMTTYKFNAELKLSSGGLSEGAKIGLGVGLGVGGGLLLLGIIVTVILVKGKN